MSTELKSNPLLELSNAMADAVAKAGATTVLVNARRRMPASGVGYAPDLVLTAEHVVEREDDLRVVLPNGEEISARLVGRDPSSDLALLRLSQPGVMVAEIAEYAARPGQLVLALGRPSPDGIEASLGVVSAIGGTVRTRSGGLLQGYIRTDTIPYPGFSGGPLVDAAGRVLGINTSGLARGAPLTVPVKLVWAIAKTLTEHGKVRRGFLGVRSQPVELPAYARAALGREQDIGLLLVGVESGSPAANGGLMLGDILVGIAGQAVNDPDELIGMLTGEVVGKPTPVEILRGGQRMTPSVTVGERS